MKDCKFKQLILDVYKEWQKPERTFVKNMQGIELKYNNFWGTIYGVIAKDTFDNIINIERYMDICNPDMFLLNSRVTRQEIEVYEWNLKDYKIVDNELVLMFNNGVINFEM